MTMHRVIIGDSRNMSELGDESVHLVVTSPPGGVLSGERKASRAWRSAFGACPLEASGGELAWTISMK
jgi:DNA modification methylase